MRLIIYLYLLITLAYFPRFVKSYLFFICYYHGLLNIPILSLSRFWVLVNFDKKELLSRYHLSSIYAPKSLEAFD